MRLEDLVEVGDPDFKETVVQFLVTQTNLPQEIRKRLNLIALNS